MSKAHFLSLLSRIAEASHYPDEASSTLGRLLAQACMAQNDVLSANDEILNEFVEWCNRGCVAIASAYFHWMARLYVSSIEGAKGNEQSLHILEQAVSHCRSSLIILTSSTSAGIHDLNDISQISICSMIHVMTRVKSVRLSYVSKFLQQIVVHDLKDKPGLLSLLLTESIRECFEYLSYSIESGDFKASTSLVFQDLLYPLLSPCLLQINADPQLKFRVLETLSRHYRSIFTQGNNTYVCIETLKLHCLCLGLILKRNIVSSICIPKRMSMQSKDNRDSFLNVLSAWVCIAIDDFQGLLTHLRISKFGSWGDIRVDLQEILSTLIDQILGYWVPFVVSSPGIFLSANASLSSFSRLMMTIDTLEHEITKAGLLYSCYMVPEAFFRFISSCLFSLSEVDTCQMMNLLYSILPLCFTRYTTIIVKTLANICFTISFMFSASSLGELAKISQELYVLVDAQIKKRNVTNIVANTKRESMHLLSLMKFGANFSGITYILKSNEENMSNCIEKQLTLLICLSNLLDGDIRTPSISFIQSVIGDDPQLCVRIVPVLFALINKFSISKPLVVIDLLSFLCNVAPRNKTTMKQVWNAIDKFASSKSPDNVRSTSLLLCSTLLRENRRLFRKVSDLLLSHVSDPCEEVRIAVVGTIANICEEYPDMAVSEFVGALQYFLHDESALVKAMSLRSLHFLCINDTMDFGLLVRALGKRLTFSFDQKGILQQDQLIAREIITILGDGEFDGSVDSDVSDSGPLVNQQIQQAVGILLGIATEILSQNQVNDVLLDILKNLSRYNLECFEVDAELVRTELLMPSNMTESNRYCKLVQIASDSISKFSFDFQKSSSIVLFVRKIVELEFDALGKSLWKKPSTVSKVEEISSFDVSETSNHGDKVLPDPNFMLDMYSTMPCSETAVGALYGVNTSKYNDFDDLIDTLSDVLCEIENYGDFLEKIFVVNGWIEAMRNVCTVALHLGADLHKRLTELSDLGVHDNYFLAISSFCFVADSSQQGYNKFLDETYHNVLSSLKKSKFENPDDGFICLSMIGSCFIRLFSIERLDEILSILESSTKRNTDGSFFGAHLGMSILSQALLNNYSDERLQAAMKRVCRILLTLFEEFVSCIGNFPYALHEVVLDSLQSRHVKISSVDLVRAISNNKIFVLEKDKVRCQSLCLSLAIAMPCFGVIHQDLCIGLLYLSFQLPSGVKKGFLTASSFHICDQNGLIDENEKKRIYRSLEADIENTSMGFEDSLVSIAAFCPSSLLKYPPKMLDCLESSLRGSISTPSLMQAIHLSYFLCIAKIPCFDGSSSFGNPSNLKSGIEKEDIEKLVTRFFDKHVSYSSNISFVALRGLLCSIGKHHSAFISDRLFQNRCKSKSKRSATISSSGFQNRLVANEDTLTGFLLRYLEDETLKVKCLSIPLAALQSSLLPVEFTHNIKAILKDCMRTNQFNNFKSSILLLVSQIKKRRGVSDKKEFVDLFIEFCCRRLSDVNESFGVRGEIFILSAFEQITFHLPSNHTTALMKSIFDSCLNAGSVVATHEATRSFFQTTTNILNLCKKHEDKKNDKHQHLSSLIFENICHILLDAHKKFAKCFSLNVGVTEEMILNSHLPLWVLYLECIAFIPFDQYEKSALSYGAINVSKSIASDTPKIFTNAYLLHFGYFDNVNQQKSEVEDIIQNWILSSVSSNTRTIQQMLCMSLSQMRMTLNDDLKRKFILEYLDRMISQDKQLGKIIEHLAVQVAFWHAQIFPQTPTTSLFLSNAGALVSSCGFICIDQQSMTVIFDCFLQDLHITLGMVAKQLGVLDRVHNIIFRRLDQNTSELENSVITLLNTVFLETSDEKDIERFIAVVEAKKRNGRPIK